MSRIVGFLLSMLPVPAPRQEEEWGDIRHHDGQDKEYVGKHRAEDFESGERRLVPQSWMPPIIRLVAPSTRRATKAIMRRLSAAPVDDGWDGARALLAERGVPGWSV